VDLVDYRFSQALCLPTPPAPPAYRPPCREWLVGLSPEQRARLRTAAVAAIEPIMEPYRPRVVRLVAAVN
jgi:hypothetical protein